MMNGLGGILIGVFVIGMIVMGVIWGTIELSTSNKIKVKNKLEPISIEVLTIDGISDTTYVYKLP